MCKPFGKLKVLFMEHSAIQKRHIPTLEQSKDKKLDHLVSWTALPMLLTPETLRKAFEVFASRVQE